VPGLDANLEGAQDYGSVVHAYIEGGMSGVPPEPDVGRAGGSGSGGNVGNSGASRAELWQKFEASEYGMRSAEYQLHEGPEPPATGPARMVEVPFALPIKDTEIRGRIDAIFVDGDGTFHIVDWKTGKPDKKKFEQRLQLPLYALAANRLWGIEPARIRLAYAFAPGDEVVEVDTSDGFLERSEARVRDALGRIKGGSFEPVPSRYGCSRCPVMGIGIGGCPEEVPPE
jgi:DNA helicase-2/ATP-dependent DNA helicase PcrA